VSFQARPSREPEKRKFIREVELSLGDPFAPPNYSWLNRTVLAWILGASSDYLLRNDWLSSLIGALLCRLGWPEAPQGIAPCRVVCSAGLRWCGGWRRTNLRGSYDQTQIEAKGCGPLHFTIHQ